MDETTLTTLTQSTLKDLIFENYPLSFIIIVLSAYGFFIGRLVYKTEVQRLEEILMTLLDEILRK